MDPFYRPILAVLFLAAVSVAVSAFSPNSALHTEERLRKEVEEYQRRNAELEKENRSLSQEIDALSGNPKVLERSARETLGLVRSDEVIFNFEESAAP